MLVSMDAIPGRITRRDSRGTEFRDTVGRRWVFPAYAPGHHPYGYFGKMLDAGWHCVMFTTAAVYAATPEEAEAFADAHELRGPRAREYHAELS
jgi:hypothetical protein